MPIVRYVLARPYTVVATLILVALLGVGEALRMPIDIFPRMDIPVVSVVWTYAGMSAEDMQNRILTLHERQLASLVDDIARIEATSYEGVGVEKIYLHEGADVTRAVAQLGSSALVVLKYMPPNVTPPLVIRYGATDVPIIQLSLASHSLPDTRLNDLGQNIIRPALAIVHGAEVPYPYGGKPRVIMADLDAAGAAGAGPCAGGRERRAAAPERHPARGRREDRHARLPHRDEQQPRCDRGHQRLPDPRARRPHGVHARRGPRARWLPGADQFGGGRWRAGRRS